jgi:hypothetical protein
MSHLEHEKVVGQSPRKGEKRELSFLPEFLFNGYKVSVWDDYIL